MEINSPIAKLESDNQPHPSPKRAILTKIAILGFGPKQLLSPTLIRFLRNGWNCGAELNSKGKTLNLL